MKFSFSKQFYLLTLLMVLAMVGLSVLFLSDLARTTQAVNLEECTPYNISFTNITAVAFTVNWQTKGNCTGVVKYGDERDNLAFIATQKGDASAKSTHSVVVDGLRYSTQYYLYVVSNQQDYGLDNTVLIVKTKAY
jgi:hypothetical protein